MIKKLYFCALSLRFVFFIYNFFIFFNVFSLKTTSFIQLKSFFFKSKIYFSFVSSNFLKYVFNNLNFFRFLTGKIFLAYALNIHDFFLSFKNFDNALFFLPYIFLFRNFLLKSPTNFIDYFSNLYSDFGKHNYYLFAMCSKLIFSTCSLFFVLFSYWALLYSNYFWKIVFFLMQLVLYFIGIIRLFIIKISKKPLALSLYAATLK